MRPLLFALAILFAFAHSVRGQATFSVQVFETAPGVAYLQVELKRAGPAPDVKKETWFAQLQQFVAAAAPGYTLVKRPSESPKEHETPFIALLIQRFPVPSYPVQCQVTYLRSLPDSKSVDAALSAAEGDPAETARIRALVRQAYAPTLFLPKLLGANPKTFLIAGAILLGSPIWYFLAMIGPVNLILIVSIVHHKRLAARVAAEVSRR